jgi:hypothetical protein
MNMKKNQYWTTLDINFAAYLEYRGILISLENLNGRIIFTAPQSDELYKLTSAFNSNDPVPILDFVTTLKILKSRMLSAKGAVSWVK